MQKTILARTALGLSGSAIALGSAQAAADEKTLDTVVVIGQNLNSELLPENILDTPQSINVVPAEVIRQQGVNNLQDALKNVPGITLNAGEGGIHGDLVNIRGFSAGDDYFLDGLRDTGLYNRDVFNYERLEVLKGPASTLFGRGTTGGIINQVSKSPQLYPIKDFTLTAGTNAEARGTADVNYVLDDDAAVRVNLMAQRNNTEGRPFARTQKWGAAPSIALGLGTDTVYSLNYLHEQEDSIPDPGIPFLVGAPAPVAHNVFYGLPGDDRFQTDTEVATAKVTHKFDDTFTVNDTARFGSYWFDSRQTNPTYGSADCFTSTASPYYYSGGTLCATLPSASRVPTTTLNPLFPAQGIPASQVYVERDRPSSKGIITTWMNDTNLESDFEFLGMRHHATVGAQEDVESASLKRYVNQNTVIPPTPLLAPNPYQSFPGRQTTLNTTPVTRTSTLGLYMVNNIDITPQWNLVAGFRFDHFGATYNQPFGARPAHYTHNDNVGSPRAALVYKPSDNSSVYFSYGTSFNPSAETLSLAANNQGLAPERDHTYEVGGKIDVLDGKLGLTAAAFNTVKSNARISDPLNPALQTLAGTERINGVEFGAQGRLTDQWEITAGFTYLAPKAVGLVAAGVAGPIPNVANDQANLWAEYTFDESLLDQLEVGFGVNWTGRRQASTDTLSVPGTILVAQIPSYVTLDAMVSYPLSDNFKLQLNAYNLGNAAYYANSYYTRPGENHVIPGAGRTFLLTGALSL